MPRSRTLILLAATVTAATVAAVLVVEDFDLPRNGTAASFSSWAIGMAAWLIIVIAVVLVRRADRRWFG